MKLKHSNKKIENSKSLVEFIENYLNEGSPATVEIESKLECSDGKRRSFSDLKMLCNNYLPELNVEMDDIIKCLPEIKVENGKIIAIRYCSQVRKCVVTLFPVNQWHWVYLDDFNIILCGLKYNERTTDIGSDGISEQYIIDLLREERVK